jgi:hypothetical protein
MGGSDEGGARAVELDGRKRRVCRSWTGAVGSDRRVVGVEVVILS